jgi:hypothetical protein
MLAPGWHLACTPDNVLIVIRDGQLAAFHLFDVAESIELDQLSSLLRADAERTRVASKPALPSYVQYQRPPLQIDGSVIGFPEIDGFRIRFKIFDYGVVSLLLARPFSGTWSELTLLANRLSSDRSFETGAERICRALVDQIGEALVSPRRVFLSEDYFVYSVSALERPMSADALITEHGGAIAQLLRAEIEPLSTEERDEVLRHRLSFLANDLVIPTWSSALVYDTAAGVQAALDIFEYANSQLLQFRYYDELLDGELARIYRELETRATYRSWWPRRRYTRAARHVHALFIDVNELAERTENALKLVGDVYAARLLALAHSRLGVSVWRASVHDKLKTLDNIYRFAVDQTAMERGELLEMAIVAILVFELILFFMGIMK